MKLFSTLALSLFTISTFAQPKAKPDTLAANIDKNVKPGDDFFLYANGGWINRTPIPAAESSWGIGNMVQDDIYAKLKKINIDAAKLKPAKGSTTQKIGSFWTSAMDSAGATWACALPFARASRAFIRQLLQHSSRLFADEQRKQQALEWTTPESSKSEIGE